MSQKSRTFANVIELERHIEILLLSNDCVIVPDLGGFMAHHIEARYDEEDRMFLPPLRTLGFNPQLKLNDSLLAQSYVEAYDISYPEAVRRIEAEVAELKQHLENEGFYEMNDIGLLKVNNEGKIEFSPCEAGILTPELYGLSSFEMKPISQSADGHQIRPENKVVELPITRELVETTEKADDDTATASGTPGDSVAEPSTDNEERLITIKMSWVRNAVAIAAALLAFLLMTKPVSDGVQTGLSMSQINLPIIQKEVKAPHTESLKTLDALDTTAKAAPQAPTEEEVVFDKEVAPAPTTANAPADSPTSAASESPANTPSDSPASAANDSPAKAPAKTPAKTPAKPFCIVAASQVSQKGANEYVAKLRKEGFADARVCLYNNVRRVILGSYSTQAEAYRQLQKVHAHQELSEAWVYEVKE